jgi:hypothetical protein
MLGSFVYFYHPVPIPGAFPKTQLVEQIRALGNKVLGMSPGAQERPGYVDTFWRASTLAAAAARGGPRTA